MNATLRNAVIAVAVMLTAGAANAASWVDMHGTNCVIEYPANTTNGRNDLYRGWGLDFTQQTGVINWVRCPITAEGSDTTDHILLTYYQEKAGSVKVIDVYNGDRMVKQLSVPEGVAGWNSVHLTFESINFNHGLGVAVHIPKLVGNVHYVFADVGALWQ